MQSSFTSRDSESEEHKQLERRRNRFTNQSTSIIHKPIQVINEPLIGTCERLEKNYLRLTSAPNPSTIRPLIILEQAFPFVLNKYKSNNDWSYISNQLKSIRQDLMVQSIRNDFTVLVYEENARIALEMGDLDQFIQCQTQLELLYDSGCNPTHLIEFLIYRLLYSLLINDYKKANRILSDIDKVNISTLESNNLDIVLEFCSSFRRKNYIQLFILYRSLPKLTCCLVNFFIDIYRKQMIQILIWGFAPTLPIDVVTTMLAYESNEICYERLSSLGVIFINESMSIDYQVELVIDSTDKERTFYCSSRVNLDKQGNKLMASIDKPVSTSPEFILKHEQANSTAIRIRIIPNGYIGVNRIICHWDNNITYGQIADLIIGEQPGRIQLKESCQAYDYRYVQCIFDAPTIARAFRNGFPRLYEFSEYTSETEYHHPPELVSITDENELVFNFVPREKNRIPKKISMSVNMTLRRFGSAYYRFNIEPIHTTKVDFRIQNISSNHLTIMINHNKTRAIRERFCSGHVSQVDNQKTLIAVQDISKTSDQKISIDGLRSSTQYKICLYCFYEQTDQSFRKEICHTIKTKGSSDSVTKHLTNPTGPPVRIPLISDSDTSSIQVSNGINEPPDDPSFDEKYQHMDGLMEQMIKNDIVAPDTIDLRNQKNAK
ncbi:unnamed protein product [Rotaria sp. Silwood1]|nr:unnamed protein product [Rotaria sp. Silwood1]CAF0948082.1 unnamed protein product [Rotaria sp. Silwood1]CAF3384440.1 unnamed protein product [Rotaria sp. Silwood1]CAF4538233.1 unnamed protein product [Rotaria sp. Silwood1]